VAGNPSIWRVIHEPPASSVKSWGLGVGAQIEVKEQDAGPFPKHREPRPRAARHATYTIDTKSTKSSHLCDSACRRIRPFSNANSKDSNRLAGVSGQRHR
jgi:hypothetical protein